jgi:hypothetical protein
VNAIEETSAVDFPAANNKPPTRGDPHPNGWAMLYQLYKHGDSAISRNYDPTSLIAGNKSVSRLRLRALDLLKMIDEKLQSGGDIAPAILLKGQGLYKRHLRNQVEAKNKTATKKAEKDALQNGLDAVERGQGLQPGHKYHPLGDLS